MSEKLYFAYGSNMNLDQMAFRCPEAEVVGVVRVDDYRLTFCGSSYAGVATILPQPGSHVDGVLWRISEADEKHLDFYEGFPRLYGKEPIEVTDHNGQKMTVMVYTMNSPFKECLMPPSEGYLDCISKTRRANMGEAPMYYVQNSHPAIISRETFHMAQVEIARRKALQPSVEKKASTAVGKYSRYALSEVLVCGECGSRYKRVTWSAGGKRIVWRCSNRLENGKKYCRTSPTLKEEELHAAIVRAINKFNSQDRSTYLELMKATICEAIGIKPNTEEIDELKRRIEALNKSMMDIVQQAVRNNEDMEDHESEFKEISDTILLFRKRISELEQIQTQDAAAADRMAQIQAIIDDREAHQDVYDDSIVRQMVECIKVFPDGRLEVYFGGGYCVEERI